MSQNAALSTATTIAAHHTTGKLAVGHIEVITGPMFSGKSAELVRRVQLAQIARMSTVVFRPKLDTRVEDQIVISRNGTRIAAHCVLDSSVVISKSLTALVVAIDEAQFFDAALPSVLMTLAQTGKRIIVAGLDLDFTAMPFGPMPEILAIADTVEKVNAVCVICGSFEGRYTQRLIDGNPATLADPLVVIEHEEHVEYQARCRLCYVRPQ